MCPSHSRRIPSLWNVRKLNSIEVWVTELTRGAIMIKEEPVKPASVFLASAASSQYFPLLPRTQ